MVLPSFTVQFTVKVTPEAWFYDTRVCFVLFECLILSGRIPTNDDLAAQMIDAYYAG